jgi:hypothetical protein
VGCRAFEAEEEEEERKSCVRNTDYMYIKNRITGFFFSLFPDGPFATVLITAKRK